MAELTITEYTDPACPFAWSAEPNRWRLRWLYGDQLDWAVRMVGLAEDGSVYEDKGFTAERMSASFRHLSQAHHMPMDTSLRPRMAGTVPACRAVVAVRRHAPEREWAMLRALRVLHFSGHLLDEPATLDAAAERVGIEPADLRTWLAEPETEAVLRADLAEARSPRPGALALAHKLALTETGHRYTCPSYEITRVSDGESLSVPGFQPLAAYEVAIANLAPHLSRQEDPEDVREVLDWAGEPLATIEVATICATDLDDARERLGRVADEAHLGFDGLWHLDGVVAAAETAAV
ncbi:MAG TPA: DsbA family protein [Solirubrobacteraceae bacterium]|nr:DsbA family protein [Solirubrobacteraceae bacterium]